MGRVVIVGGGPAGLAAGMLLAESGVEVTVVEKDPAEPPASSAEAWDAWHRPGVAQFRQAHTVLAAGAEILRTRLPTVFKWIEDLGGHPVSPFDLMPSTIEDRSPWPDEERRTLLGARRPVYELAFALAARDTAGLEIRRGSTVVDLMTGPEAIPGVPHIDKVVLDTGEELNADLVIDAGGRRSPVPALLEASGAVKPPEQSEDSRFIYFTRFYRRREGGDFPNPYGMFLMPAGSISVLTIPADNSTWSVTLYATTSDKAMRAVRDPVKFECVVRSIPARASWVEGDALTDVAVMAGITDRQRSMTADGAPVATGILPLADAWACTNPSLGRGISMALMHATALAPVIVDNLNDPAGMIRAWHIATDETVAPWHRATLEQDRARNNEMEAFRNGASKHQGMTPEVAAFYAATFTDVHAYRAWGEIVSLLARPEEVMTRPEVHQAIAKSRSVDIPMPVFPTRTELELLLE